jgi:hypothetical protein
MILGVEYTKHAISTAKETTCRPVKGRDHIFKCAPTGTLVLCSYFSTIALFFLHHESVQIYVYIRAQFGG